MTHLNILYIYINESLIIVSPLRMYSAGRGILWFSRRYAAASTSADISLWTWLLKESWTDCFHILYVDWHRWWIVGKQVVPVLLIEGVPSPPPPPPPRIVKNKNKITIGLLHEKLVVIYPLVIHICTVIRSYFHQHWLLEPPGALLGLQNLYQIGDNTRQSQRTVEHLWPYREHASSVPPANFAGSHANPVRPTICPKNTTSVCMNVHFFAFSCKPKLLRRLNTSSSRRGPPWQFHQTKSHRPNILNIWTIAYHIRHGPSAFQMSPAHHTVRTASSEIGQCFARPGCHGSWTMCVSGSGDCNGCPWTSGPPRRSTDGRNGSLASVLGPLATTLEWHWLLFIVFLLL